MSALQNALQQVGYKPTGARRKDLAAILDEVIAPITKHPKTHVTKAGGFYRVRFEGRATSCFGSTIVEAKKRLRTLEKEL
jgi:hypothetical protein